MRRLVLAPHPDDEVLWCFSKLLPGTHVVIVSEVITAPLSKKIVEERGGTIEFLEFPNGELEKSRWPITKILEAHLKENQYDEL